MSIGCQNEYTFEYFWNNWGTKQDDLVLAICGSAASWMIQKVVNSKGGLHNRITKKIRLLPFTLAETKNYLAHRNVKPDRYQIVQLYMAVGGVPHYLKEIKPGLSAAQNIDTLCFTRDGLLKTEFNNLYQSLFAEADKHLPEHIPEIEAALGIAGVFTEESIWKHVPGKGQAGAQIDLLLDRNDFCISICEMKFSTNEFTIDKSYATDLQNKMEVFREKTNTRKRLFLTMVTTFGTKDNTYKVNLVQNDITLESLFA